MHDIKCKICDSNKIRFLFKKDRFDVIKCRECKIVFINPFLSSSDLYNNQDYYSEIIAHDERKTEKERFPWKQILTDINKLIKDKGKLLDVGSGTGFFLNLAQKRGWEAYGIEPSSFAYNYSLKKYNLNIINKTLKEANFSEAFFDVITLWNVLEHLTDPLDMFLDVQKILKVNGLVAFSVPNINSFEAILFRDNWAELKPLEKGHLYFFSPYTLNYILNKLRFKVEKIFSLGGFGFRAHIFNKNINVSQKRKSILLESIASIIRYILGLFKKGGILIVVARKLDKYNQ